MNFKLLLFTLAGVFSYIPLANAYIGPGMGGGVIVAVLGIVGAIFLGLFGIIYYPVKRALKKRKKAKSEVAAEKLEEAAVKDEIKSVD